ncbi:hypothetical protein WBG99_19040 [Streptomyces sp. TG1A-60]|uniref:hypothetical protein n=1 Tax=Streptomyces sp. TG1A-60 TaxID=3129111 RepID=UPI0030D201F8
MSEERTAVSAEMPEFTGNLEQLETNAGDIAFDGMSLGAAGLLIDAQLQPPGTLLQGSRGRPALRDDRAGRGGR